MQQPEHFQPLPCPGRLCVIAEPLNLFCLFLTQLDDDRHSWLPENSPLRITNHKENYPQPNPKNQESAISRYSISTSPEQFEIGFMRDAIALMSSPSGAA